MALTMQFQTQFKTGKRTRKQLEVRNPAEYPTENLVEELPPGNIPRISRLMALAIRFDGLLRDGVARDYADLARLGGVTRARLTQIMNLLNLAPDIQEEILFLPRTVKGSDIICERNLRPLAATADWRKQRRLWSELAAADNS